MQRKTAVLGLIACLLLACVAAVASTNPQDAQGEKSKVKGFITNRDGDSLVVKTKEGPQTVLLSDDTKTKDNKGLLGLRKEALSDTVLIPGLKVDIDATKDDQGHLVAKTITVDGDDLETAEMIQAGLHPTATQVATNVDAIEANKQGIAVNSAGVASNKQDIAEHEQKINQNMQDIKENSERFSSLADYDTKGQATANFDVGSSTLSPKDQNELKQLASTAKGLKGYLIQVVGYADSSGSAAMNTELSEDRAQAVVTYLIQQCGVPVRHIVAPGAMGEYGATASNETPSGRAENRKVLVKVLVNKGVAGT